ncbi:MAG: hypothetical protein AAFU53_02905 [Cyanobacteria bacterium J06632_3]
MNRRLYRRLLQAIVLFALILGVVLLAPGDSWAAALNNQGQNQALNESAILTAPEPDAKITVYLQPEANEKKVGYGVNGDVVTILEQVSDNHSLIWNHIRFDNPPYAEGWLQETFLTLNGSSPGASPNTSIEVESQGQNQRSLTNSGISTPIQSRYLGNVQLRSSQRFSLDTATPSQPNQTPSNQTPSSQRFNQQFQPNQHQSYPQRSPQSYSQRNQN